MKFFKSEKGWGVIVSPDLPSDIWVHFSHLEGPGFRALHAGDLVDFDAEAAQQDGFDFRATRARLIRHGPVPLLRRQDGRVVIAPDGTPDTPLGVPDP